MLKDYFFLAFGNLKHRGLRSWLTILGIFIGIAAVVSLISLGAGLREAITGQFGSIGVDILTIQNKGAGFGPPGSMVVEKLNDNDVKIIQNVNGVKLVITRLIRVVKVEFNEIANFKYIFDLPDDSEKLKMIYETFSMETSSGRLIQEGDSGVVLIGSDFGANKEFEKNFVVGKKIKINGKEFEIMGVLKKMDSIQLNGMMIMPTKDLQNLLQIKNEYDLIVAQVEDKNKIKIVSEQVQEKLRRDRNENLGEETFTVQTPLQALSGVNTILNIINIIVVGIACISLFVGGVGIANTMYTSILERTKEIGVMKAIGAKNSDILWIFLIESGLLGLVGGIVGALIGILIAIGISNIANSFLGENLFRIQINYFLLFGAVLFSFVVGVLSGVLPAIQASKLKVVEALRG